MPVPEIDDLAPQSSQNNHFVVPPLHQVQQPSDKSKNHNDDQPVEQCLLVLGGLGVAHMQVVVDGELAVFIVVLFGGLAVVVVLAGGGIGCQFKQVVILGHSVERLLDQAADRRFVDCYSDVFDGLGGYDDEAVVDDMEELLNAVAFEFDCVVGLVDDPGVEVERIDLDIFLILEQKQKGVEILFLVALGGGLEVVLGGHGEDLHDIDELPAFEKPDQRV